MTAENRRNWCKKREFKRKSEQSSKKSGKTVQRKHKSDALEQKKRRRKIRKTIEWA